MPTTASFTKEQMRYAHAGMLTGEHVFSAENTKIRQLWRLERAGGIKYSITTKPVTLLRNERSIEPIQVRALNIGRKIKGQRHD